MSNKLLDMLHKTKYRLAHPGTTGANVALDEAIALVKGGETRSLTVALKGCTGFQMIDHLCIPMPPEPKATDYDRSLANAAFAAQNGGSFIVEKAVFDSAALAIAKKRAELDGNE